MSPPAINPKTNPTCAAALAYAARGIPVFPCKPRNKKPLTEHGFKDATTEADTIKIWWRRWPLALIGVPTGPASGVDVLDLDVKNGKNGFVHVPDWERRSNIISRTRSGGAHLYFNSDGTIPCTVDNVPGVDTRGHGGYVIVPPSPGYTWVNGSDFSALPPWPADLRPLERAAKQPATNESRSTEEQPLAEITDLMQRDAGAGVSTDPADLLPPADPAKIKAALNVIPSDDYQIWFEIGAALNRELGDAGRELFHAWSKKSGKYDAVECDRKWEDCGEVRGFTAGTIFHYANEADPNWPERVEVKPNPEPVDLWASFPPPELPAGLLPAVIENYARAEAKTMGADVAGLVMGALTVCAAAISDSIQLQVKKHSEYWKESARLWCALVGDPSSKKTPILRLVARPLACIDARLHRKYVADKSYYDNLPPDEKKKADTPKQWRVRIEDTTIEAAQEVLKDSPDGVLCLQDELSGWFGGMDRYSGKGAAKDRAFWLQSFNGGEYVYNRVGRGSIIIENLSASMLGGIQPEPMRKLAADSVDDGLLQRLCPIILRPSTIGRDEPDAGGWKFYDDLVNSLHLMRAPDFVLRFDEAAQKIRQQLEQKHLNLMTCEAVNKKLSAHLGKYDGIFARLCVLWHCIETVGGDRPADLSPTVTGYTAQRVADFMHKFLLPHALSFYAGVLGLSDDHDRLSAVAGYVLAHGLDKITSRDVQRGDRTMRQMTKRDTDQIFEQLEAFGWIIRAEGKKPSSLPVWQVNPMVHQLFAERAAREASRRLSVREAIAEALGRNG
jgi:hypothetical protein